MAITMSGAWWFLDAIAIGVPVVACLLFGVDNGGAFFVSMIIVAPMIRAGLETLIVRSAHSPKTGRKDYWLLTLANAVCITIATYVLILYDSAHPAVAMMRHH